MIFDRLLKSIRKKTDKCSNVKQIFDRLSEKYNNKDNNIPINNVFEDMERLKEISQKVECLRSPNPTPQDIYNIQKKMDKISKEIIKKHNKEYNVSPKIKNHLNSSSVFGKKKRRKSRKNRRLRRRS